VNIQEYISSGIVESYVLGLADDSEQKEFEQYCAQYPEVLAARKAFEETVEQHALSNAVQPPEHVKRRFLEAIDEFSSINQTKVITMENSAPVRKSGFLRFLAAASIILLIGAAWLAYSLYSSNKDLKSKNESLQARANSSDSILNKIVDEQKAQKKSDITVVNMQGTKAAPHSSASVFWDTASASVYLVLKNMPKLPSDQQYQLWAIIDKTPKNLGVFDFKDENFILRMENTQKADAFAITIEKKGGNPSPTLEKMQAIGSIKQSQ
jgi:anti-sigma-K factor RskA